MPAVNQSLIDRWKLGTIPKLWDDAQGFITDRLGNLERILNILHGAIEYPRPSVDASINAAGNTNVTATAAVDIGVSSTFVPIVDMTVLIQAVFDVQCSLFGAANQYFIGSLVMNSVTQPKAAVWGCNALSNRTTAHQFWTIALKSGTSYSLKLQAATTNVATTFQINSLHTSMAIQRYPNTYRPS